MNTHGGGCATLVTRVEESRCANVVAIPGGKALVKDPKYETATNTERYHATAGSRR